MSSVDFRYAVLGRWVHLIYCQFLWQTLWEAMGSACSSLLTELCFLQSRNRPDKSEKLAIDPSDPHLLHIRVVGKCLKPLISAPYSSQINMNLWRPGPGVYKPPKSWRAPCLPWSQLVMTVRSSPLPMFDWELHVCVNPALVSEI